MAEAPGVDLTEETIFTWGAPPLKFGAGAVEEIGFEMAQFGARRVLILTDPRINELGIPARIAQSLTKHGISSEIYDGCHVEPTDDSMDKAAGYARGQGPWDGVIAVGGRRPWRSRNLPKRWRARNWSFFAASRARTRSRSASCAASGTHTAVKSPAR